MFAVFDAVFEKSNTIYTFWKHLKLISVIQHVYLAAGVGYKNVLETLKKGCKRKRFENSRKTFLKNSPER